VIPVSVDQDLNSATAYRGQNFTASVTSSRPGDSEFPQGTKLQGVITGVTKKEGNNPGVLDLAFNAAILPDGSRVQLAGEPISLDNDSTVNSGGHIVASEKAKKGTNLKVIGIGAGAGFVIGRILKKDGALPAILGAAGGIGQPLSLLMKLNPLVSSLSLYDIAGTPGVAADVSHINSPALVKGFMGDDQLGEALEGSDVVIIPAGVPRKPGMTRDDLFNINAGIVKGLCTAIAKHCPNALVNMISNPVNSTVPIAAEVFKKAGTYDEKKLFGVTTLDVVRAKTFYAGKAGVPVTGVNVPVVGGHAGITILPLFSQATPASNSLSQEDIEALTKRTQDGGTEVVEAKAGKGSATLSMAYAGAVFADACLKGLNGVPDIVECSFVQSTVTELPFFASKVRLGKNGVEEVLGLGELNEFEKKGLENLKGELKSSIDKGIKFAHGN